MSVRLGVSTMRKLLSAGFSRLWKNKYFWICIICMVAFAAVMVVSSYISAEKYDVVSYIDGVFFSYVLFIGTVIAAFISLFLGTEYSDGTIRNKLIVGHSRSAIYLSNYIICSVSALAISAAYMATCVIIGLPLGLFFMTPTEQILITILTALILCLSFTGLFTLIAMLCQNKAAVAVICVVGAFVLLFGATFIQSSLSQPEMVNEYYYDEAQDEWIEGDLIPNQSYVGGIKRQIYEFLQDFLPGGQSIQISQAQINQSWLLQGYSIIIAIVSSVIGLIIFRRKDLK